MKCALTCSLLALVFSFAQPEISKFPERIESSFIRSFKPTWFDSYFVVASILQSQSYAVTLYKSTSFCARNFSCLGLVCKGNMTSRHATGLRILLLIAGIESNPGPVNLQQQSKPILEAMLKLVHPDGDAYVPTGTKVELIAELEKNNPNIVQLAYVQAQAGPSRNIVMTGEAAGAPALPVDSGARTIKLPEFYQKDTRIWFEQIEQILPESSPAVRKSSLLRVLPTNVLFDSGAKASDSYEEIKANIISNFDDSMDRNLRKVLAEQQLGDRKPSAVLRQLQHFAPNNENLVRLRFFEILPDSVRMSLAALEDVPIDKIALTADRLMEHLPSFHQTNNVNTATVPAPSVPTSLEKSITDLTICVNALMTRRPDDRGRSRERPQDNRDNFRARSRSRSFNPNGQFCWYHFRFGEDARTCRDPCSWNSSHYRQRQGPAPGNASAPPPMRQATE